MRLTSTLIVIVATASVVGCGDPAPYGPEAPRASVSQWVPAIDDGRPAFDDLSLGQTSTDGQSANVSVAGQIARPPAAGATLGAPGPGPVQQTLMNAYLGAVRGAPAACRLRAEVLAAIAQVESGSAGGQALQGHRVVPGVYGPLLSGGEVAAVADTDEGRLDGDAEWDRAVGPMQFIPSAWAAFGSDGDGDGTADPQNVYDAVVTTSLYLCSGGRDLSVPTELAAAILSYNRSGPYLLAVLDWVAYFGTHGLVAIGPVSIPVPERGPTARRRTEPATVTAEVIKQAVEKAAQLPVAEPPRRPGSPTSPGSPASPVVRSTPMVDRPYGSTTVRATTRATTPTTVPPSSTTTTPDPDPTTTTPDPDPTTTTPEPDPTTTTPEPDPTTTTPEPDPTTTTAEPDPTTTTADPEPDPTTAEPDPTTTTAEPDPTTTTPPIP